MRKETGEEKQVPDSGGKSRYDALTEKAAANASTRGIPDGADR